MENQPTNNRVAYTVALVTGKYHYLPELDTSEVVPLSNKPTKFDKAVADMAVLRGKTKQRLMVVNLYNYHNLDDLGLARL